MKIKIYFLELKNRLILLILTWLTVVLVCYIFKEILLITLIKQSTCIKEPFYFIFTDVAEIFYVYIMLIFFVGNQVLLMYFLYNVLVFIAPGLFYSEYLYLVRISKVCLVSFILSILAYHKIFFPSCWDFFLSFQNLGILKSTTLYFESKISEYLFFYISFYHACVFYSQILVVLFIIFDFSKTKKELAKNFRKFFYYFFILFSTLVTPPDVFSQLFLSTCLVFSYEILVFYFIYKSNRLKKSLIRQPIETN